MDPIIRQLFVRVHARYACSPYAADLAAFARWLFDCGYWPRYAQRLVFRAKRSLESARFLPGRMWSLDELSRAFSRRCQRQAYRQAQFSFGCFLQSRGKLVPATPKPHASVVTAYAQHLKELCGFAADTITGHVWQIGAFLQWALPKSEAIGTLNARHIEEYIEHRAPDLSRRSLRQTIDALRAFLRYCFDRGLIAQRLDEIERPVSFRDELPPRALPWPLIRSFLRSIDRHDRTGWRDFVILHLMAHYGLRPGEITRLRVESIDWRKRTLTVEQSKTHSWLILPLDERTLRLLTQYVGSNQLPLETNPILAGGTAGAGRFQILVEYAPGVFVSTASAERIEDAVEFFLKQPPGCEAGEIALFDRNERRVIGSVKWKVEPTENGLRVPHRHNLFCDWNTALVALEVQRRTEVERGSLVELSA